MKVLCVIIHTCDKYEFCWEMWYKQLTKYWIHDVKIYFVNENKPVFFPGVEQLKTGAGEWSDRLIRALDMIDYDNVLYMQEDAWMIKPLDLGWWYHLYNITNADAIRLFPANDKMYKIDSDYRFANDSPYLVTHQPSIMKKAFLRACLEPGESPWTNEIKGTKRIRGKGYSIWCGDTDKWYIGACRHGKFTDEAKELMK